MLLEFLRMVAYRNYNNVTWIKFSFNIGHKPLFPIFFILFITNSTKSNRFVDKFSIVEPEPENTCLITTYEKIILTWDFNFVSYQCLQR